jgi:signal transduction histidine kinase
MSVRTKGSGLGLFIVRSVARRHGGKAFAESEGAGRGSTFTLLLPRPAEPA